ncbi:hypothetical protein [Streptomyces montanisoli]|uniref:Large membrane protein n=1 Tax=Streptomyces montanisoli TaxID=2798581 RepID=A0A940RXF8_9ACTN|nr:hypothetical protein [Streptomyces montanisoli]MBP0460281.1 hypothetical protein [Streptomyces montanisoli]
MASVVAAVLVVAGGGTYLAVAADGGGGGSPQALPTLRVGDPPERIKVNGPVNVVSEPPRGIAPGEPDPRGTLYRVSGPLPAGPDKAPVYDRGADVTKARVAALAKALGVSGAPRSSGDAWLAGTAADGGGPLLRVQKKAPGAWTFSRYSPTGGDNCGKGKPCTGSTSLVHGGGAVDRVGGGGVGGGGGAVSEDAAKQAAAPVLKALGQGGARVDASRLLGAVRVVDADPLVDGLPTYGWTTGLQVGPDGRVESGGGELALPEAGTSYPAISATAALKALNLAASGAGPGAGCATSAPVIHGPVTGAEAGPAAPACTASTPEVPKAPQQRTVPVDKVEFGLAARAVNGRLALVPSWLFTVEPGGGSPAYRVTQTAVAPAYLRSAPPHGMKPGGGTGASGASSLSYTTHGRDLTLRFYGGVCGEYTLSADESGAAVKVRLQKPTPKPGQECMALAKRLTKTVTLKQPLGDRKVISATTGTEVPRAGT